MTRRWLALLALPLMAQTAPPANVIVANGQSRAVTPVAIIDASGGLFSAQRAVSTVASGTVTSANTFQSILASSATRSGCAIQNTSSATLLVFLGAPGSATAGTSFQISPGGTFSCASPGGLIVTDQISATAATAGSSFIVVSQ